MVHAPLKHGGELFIIWYETFYDKWEQAKKFKVHITSASTKKLKPGEFEVCNMKCFESGSRINQDSLGSVDPDPHPSRSKWFLKLGQ